MSGDFGLRADSESGSPAREDILARVRSSLGRRGGVGDDDGAGPDAAAGAGASAEVGAAAGVPRDYRHSGSSSAGERLDLLVDRLEDYDARVRRVPDGGIAEAVGGFLGADGDASVLVPNAVPREWLADFAGTVVLDSPDAPLGLDEVDGVDAVVTGSFCAIADTGTIVLVGPESGRRIDTLLPDHHVVVVRAADVVELVPGAISRLVDAGCDTAPITMVSGPSATVDIEFVRVAGVHGPRRLDVVIAE